MVVPLLVHAADGCKLNRFAVLPVTMDGLRPTVEAQINGTPALFTLDSGAFWSMLSPASAQQYALRLDYNRVPGLYVRGIGSTSTSSGKLQKPSDSAPSTKSVYPHAA